MTEITELKDTGYTSSDLRKLLESVELSEHERLLFWALVTIMDRLDELERNQGSYSLEHIKQGIIKDMTAMPSGALAGIAKAPDAD